MSAARPSQCVFCTFTRSIRIPKPARRKFHTSPVSRRKEQDQSESNEILKATRKSKAIKKDKWAQKYTPEQLAAIKAASDIIPDDKLQDGRTTVRVDPWAVKYSDDYTQIDPVTDKPVKAPWSNVDPNSRLKDTDEIADDFYKLMKSIPASGNAPEDFFQKFDQNLRLTVGKEEAERHPRSATAPEIPRMENEIDIKKKKSRPDDAARPQYQDETQALVQLMQMTGFSKQELSSLQVKTIISHRVVNQTRMGKIPKMYMLSIAGNRKGLLGIGEGKSIEGTDARLQSQYRAIRNMRPIMRYENRTIYGDVKAKVSAVELELYARPPGFGLRCQQYIWEMCKAAGISDMAARVGRSRNPMNTVKAAYQALLGQKDPEDIARGRGRKMVDVRKVYYAGQV